MTGFGHKVEIHKHSKINVWIWICQHSNCFAQGWENTQSGALVHSSLHQKHTDYLDSFGDIFEALFSGPTDKEQAA